MHAQHSKLTERPTYPVPVVWVVADEHQVVKYAGHEFVRLPQGWALVAR